MFIKLDMEDNVARMGKVERTASSSDKTFFTFTSEVPGSSVCRNSDSPNWSLS
jgi:hypothetical protein